MGIDDNRCARRSVTMSAMARGASALRFLVYGDSYGDDESTLMLEAGGGRGAAHGDRAASLFGRFFVRGSSSSDEESGGIEDDDYYRSLSGDQLHRMETASQRDASMPTQRGGMTSGVSGGGGGGGLGLLSDGTLMLSESYDDDGTWLHRNQVESNLARLEHSALSSHRRAAAAAALRAPKRTVLVDDSCSEVPTWTPRIE